MLCIGVYGGHLGEKTINSITRFCQRQQNKKVFVIRECDAASFFMSYTDAKKNEGVFLVLLKESTLLYCNRFEVSFDIILCLQAWNMLHKISDYLKEEGMIILNSDDKKTSQIRTDKKYSVITCGLNSDANVTLSSVCESILLERIQCCIQNTFSTVSGAILEPQEFLVEGDTGEKSVSGLLAAVTALMVGDMEISVMADVPIKGTSKEEKFE